ncbi:hypothetical protein NIES4072_07320 [Nostoc commune NIES-4072]|uniref:Uncharacterized protein n=1 Tax=Nostoc commune NIES-4072 TaxID=2005467 RepID=A0A2R5FLH4_NOSCO|nr:hypothetical protein [Nostoc commune]BBD65593.1 hypothetical protein NIES4070_19510 [Nostoc commune HK-02]GBG17083.1 hypothetical protein NIES4072_07320 [Nostoc commune NIES-4072]
MKKVFALIEKESAKFAQLAFFEFLVNKSNAFTQRLSFALCFALFVMGYGDLNKFFCLEATVNPIQYVLNNQNSGKENNWIWSLKYLEYLAFNLFLNFSDSLKFIYRKLIDELYQQTFQVNPIFRGKQEENYPPSTTLVDKIFEIFTALVDMLVNFAEKYNIKKLLTRSLDGSDFAQLPSEKKATVGV